MTKIQNDSMILNVTLRFFNYILFSQPLDSAYFSNFSNNSKII